MTRLFKFSDNNSEKQIGIHTEPVTEQNVNPAEKRLVVYRIYNLKQFVPFSYKKGDKKGKRRKQHSVKEQRKGAGIVATSLRRLELFAES